MFGTGRLATLRDKPKEDGLKINEILVQFHADHYSAGVMRLVVLGRESLDELNDLVVRLFSPIVNKPHVSPPVFEPFPFDAASQGLRLNVVPIKDSFTLELNWQCSAVLDQYLSKPYSYLSHLIGHEGKGSILSLLKDQGLANELSAGLFSSTSFFAAFGVQVDCTAEGITRVEDIVRTVYEYVAMLRVAGPKEWIFKEKQEIAEMDFRFKSKSKPIHYTQSVVSRMQILAPEHTLSGPILCFEYDPAAITALLDCLRPDNMLLLVTNRAYATEMPAEKVCKEEWYGTEYVPLPIDPELLATWASPESVDPALSLPAPNQFIASNFELRPPPPPPVEDEEKKGVVVGGGSSSSGDDDKDGTSSSSLLDTSTTDPVLVQDTDRAMVWWKQDTTFKKPKLNVVVNVLSSVAYESPEASTLSSLFSAICDEDLAEFAYAADVAGLHFQVGNTMRGLDLACYGYNDKLGVLLEKVASTVVSPSLSAATFERIKDKVHKDIVNFDFAQPYQHTIYHEQLCLEAVRWSRADKLDALAHITQEDLQNFGPRLLRRCKLEVLVHGNSDSDEAVAMSKVVLEALQPLTAFEAQSASSGRVVQLPPQRACIYDVIAANPENRNSAINVVYQFTPPGLGLEGYVLSATTTLLSHVLSTPFFSQLRTEEQLGYIVHAGALMSADYVPGMRFLIQSETANPNKLDKRIDVFVDSFRKTLADMSDEEFKTNVDAVVERYLEKDKNLIEETSRYVKEISNGSYDFQSSLKKAEALRSHVTKQDLVDFYDKYFLCSSAHFRKLSIRIWSGAHKDEMEAAAAEEEETTTTTTTSPPPDDASTAPPKAASLPPVVITNPWEFKRCLPLFPLRPKGITRGLSKAPLSNLSVGLP